MIIRNHNDPKLQPKALEQSERNSTLQLESAKVWFINQNVSSVVEKAQKSL